MTRQKPYFYSFEQREIDETVCMVGALSTNRPKSELGASWARARLQSINKASCLLRTLPSSAAIRPRSW